MDVALLLERLARGSIEQRLFDELAAVALEQAGGGSACVELVDRLTGAATAVARRGDSEQADEAFTLPVDGEPPAVLRVHTAEPLPDASVRALERIAGVAALLRRVTHAEAERFRLALAHAELSLFTMDRELRYTWLETPSLQRRGATLVGCTDADILPAGSVGALTALKQRVLDTGEAVSEEVSVGDRHYWLTMQPLRNGSGAVVGLAGQATDVTARRRAELEVQRLREVDALFTIGFKTSPLGMVLLTEPGEVLQANQSLAEMLGYDAPERLVGKAWTELVHPDDLGLLAGMGQALTSGDPVVVQVRYRTADGTAVHGLSATTLVRAEPDQPPTVFSQILDVTTRVRAERDLAESEARNRRILETSLEGVWTLDADDVTTFANPALAEMLDTEPEALLGRPLSDFLDADTDLRRGGRRELPLRSATGRRVWALVAASPMEDADGRYLGALAMVTDISDRKAMELRLQHLADHDHLTGIFNRRRLLNELDEQLRVCARSGRPAAALVVDLDHFKFINDTHGHLAGDRVLRTVAEVLRSRLRSTDVVARLGGDEFALVLPEVSEQEAIAVAHELRDLLADARPPIVASVGVVHFTGAEELTADEILVCADTALYEAKEHGGNQSRLYRGQATGALRWVQRIRTALAEDRFVLHGQPILDLRTGAVAKHELLIRMRADDGSLIAPGEFLPTAERFGLIREIDAWVAQRGLRLAAAGRAVTINLSGYSVDQAMVASIAREAGALDPANVTFEITETAALTNLDAARQFVEGVAALGFSVALDDFGTGFGSFVYLKHIPARFLKIDMEFVRGVGESAVDREVVRSIVGIARSLGKQTIAEGVEDPATLELLRSYGVDYVQGFAIGRPGPLPD